MYLDEGFSSVLVEAGGAHGWSLSRSNVRLLLVLGEGGKVEKGVTTEE